MSSGIKTGNSPPKKFGRFAPISGQKGEIKPQVLTPV
jgi:hypothetical protein